jgi:Zn-dependent protease with chaperone function
VAAAVVVWALAAWLLLGTRVPALQLPHVDPRDWFSPAELERIDDYRRLPRWLWVASTATELLVLAALAWQGRRLAGGAARITGGRIRQGVLVGLACALAVWVATLPAAAVSHYWQRRYGLSEQGYAAWLVDQAVNLAVTAVLVSIAVVGALALARRFGRRWWIPGAGALAVLGVAYVLLQPLVVEPLFNRFQPLNDPALAARIEALADRLGVHVGEVDVADASRRTTAANAVITGLGPTRRIALYDTLLDGRFTQDEIAAVSAHELGHAARAHTWKGAAWFVLLAVPSLALLAWVLRRRGDPGSHEGPSLVPLALLVAFALSLVALPAENAVSRRYEAEADWLSLTATEDPQAVAGLIHGLTVASLGDPAPPAWSTVLLGTHPSPVDRVAMAIAYAERTGRPIPSGA